MEGDRSMAATVIRGKVDMNPVPWVKGNSVLEGANMTCEEVGRVQPRGLVAIERWKRSIKGGAWKEARQCEEVERREREACPEGEGKQSNRLYLECMNMAREQGRGEAERWHELVDEPKYVHGLKGRFF